MHPYGARTQNQNWSIPGDFPAKSLAGVDLIAEQLCVKCHLGEIVTAASSWKE